ncbi:MAG: glycosyltransferase family 4 protein [Xanthomonadaceae bacterium]|nr:glycosyltransferase family 4 protein [Xanthomonadaceae bacterium]
MTADAPLSIAHVLLTRRFAGTERHAVELANAQAAQGHDVTLILRKAGAEDRPDAIAHRVDPRVQVVVVGNLLSSWQARRVLKKLRPDIAHAHLSGGARALKGWRDVATARIATLHIRYKPQQHQGLDGLIAIAPWQFEDMPPAMRERSVQIDNWTVPSAPSIDARTRLRDEFGIARDAFVFGALGRVEASKGLDVLVAAWQRAALPADARLVIVGQGGAWQALRAQAPADVVMPGFTDVPRDWLEAFDVFVSAARSEPFGLVLLEAMGAGLPILASASEGATHLREVIGTPLVPVGDADALATALRAMFEARPARREYPMQRFDIDDKLAEIEAFYRAVIARG